MNKHGRINYKIIKKAIHGDNDALAYISDFYTPYIVAILRNSDMYTDEYVSIIKSRLMENILKYKISPKNNEKDEMIKNAK